MPQSLFDSVMERERLVATDFGCGVAIPHPLCPTEPQTRVYVAVLPKPVFWSRQEVQLVILLVVGLQEDAQLVQLILCFIIHISFMKVEDKIALEEEAAQKAAAQA